MGIKYLLFWKWEDEQKGLSLVFYNWKLSFANSDNGKKPGQEEDKFLGQTPK